MRPFGIATTPPLLILVAACTGAAGPGPARDPAPEPPADPAPTSTSPPTPTQPTCDDWGKWDFFESASADRVHECLRAGADPNEGIIFLAARHATDPAVIDLLVAAGADPNGHSRTRTGGSPLHVAAALNPKPGIVDALVAAGADVETRDFHDRTPLHSAWRNPNPAVVQALLGSGADPLATDHHGRPADPAGCGNWNTATFARLALLADFERCLAEEGQDVHARDKDGNTILHHAVENPDGAVVALLLQAGAEVNARNADGTTPLHQAAETGNLAAVTRLLEAGADIHAPGGYGETPLHTAASDGRTEIVTALLAAGADVNVGTGGYGTPLVQRNLRPGHGRRSRRSHHRRPAGCGRRRERRRHVR
ncbi:MAG: ankyrin repeat domain-containing protein [Gemmatimonadota bacterium]|nr:ankyrin repeat domain-containing protein [Gemmatimonadota bacterium]